MRHPRRLIGLFLLATVLADLAALVAVQIDTASPRKELWQCVLFPDWSQVGGGSVFLALLFALYFSQVSLTAIWLALGRTAAPRRTAVACFLLFGWVAAFAAPIELDDLPSALSVTLLVTAVAAVSVAFPLLAAKPLGLRLGTPAMASLPRQPLQFSIAYLLGLTTATAVALSAISSVAKYRWLPFHDEGTNYELIALGVGRGLVAPLALWAALGNRRLVVRLAALLLAAVAAYEGLFLYDGLYGSTPHRYFNPAFMGFSGLLFALEAVLLLGSLLVFRWAGYRVVCRRDAIAGPQGVVTKYGDQRS
jgi:hypothetical protein